MFSLVGRGAWRVCRYQSWTFAAVSYASLSLVVVNPVPSPDDTGSLDTGNQQMPPWRFNQESVSLRQLATPIQLWHLQLEHTKAPATCTQILCPQLQAICTQLLCQWLQGMNKWPMQSLDLHPQLHDISS